jgi:hypothetical protein
MVRVCEHPGLVVGELLSILFLLTDGLWQGTLLYSASMERAETKMDRDLLEALRVVAAEEGRGECEVLEDAARFYLERGPHSKLRDAVSERATKSELIERARRRRERAGLEELSEEEALRIAVEEQHAHRRGE